MVSESTTAVEETGLAFVDLQEEEDVFPVGVNKYRHPPSHFTAELI